MPGKLAPPHPVQTRISCRALCQARPNAVEAKRTDAGPAAASKPAAKARKAQRRTSNSPYKLNRRRHKIYKDTRTRYAVAESGGSLAWFKGSGQMNEGARLRMAASQAVDPGFESRPPH